MKEKTKKIYEQLVCMPSTTLRNDTPEDFEKWFMETHKIDIKFAEEVKTNYILEDGNNRIDLLFYVKENDITKFAISKVRFSLGCSWWEDTLDNNMADLYPEEILEKYKRNW